MARKTMKQSYCWSGRARGKQRNRAANKTLHVEQYQCGICGRVFYVNKSEKSSMDLDFGCPYECDDNGEHVRDIETEVEKAKDVPD